MKLSLLLGVCYGTLCLARRDGSSFSGGFLDLVQTSRIK